MYTAQGVGLAANQVDLPLRLFVVNLAAKPNEGDEHVFINPVISHPKGQIEQEEGCLSIPDVTGDVRRPERVHLQAYNLRGDQVDLELDGLFGRVVQHEVDHLDGILFTDRLSDTGRLAIKRDLEELEIAHRIQREAGLVPSDDEIAARLNALEKKYCT
jgi:peptide deformylase